MRNLKTLIAAGVLAASLSSIAHAAPSEQEEQFALQGAAMSLLGIRSCDLRGGEMDAAMKLTAKAYEVSGVKVADYPAGEWMRKVFFFISGNSFYTAVLNRDPASVAAFCKILRDKALPD